MEKGTKQAETTNVASVTDENKPVAKKRNIKNMIFAGALILVFIAGGAFAAYVILTGQRTINTGNARVTTDLIYIAANAPGYLERFNVYSGMNVEAGQILGWLQGGESFRSPVDGVVVRVQAGAGQQVVPMEPILVIADVSNLHIQANIYESDIQDLRIGQPVAVTLDGVRNHTFSGYVRYISRITELELVGGAIMVQTGTFRRITHTVPVEITITDDVDLSLFLGTNARVSLPVLEH